MYQRIAWLVIRPHAIHIQVWHDSDNKWLVMRYKVFDAEIEAIINDWPIEWHELVNLEEVSTGLPTDAPNDPV